jgi:hypothetical protein
VQTHQAAAELCQRCRVAVERLAALTKVLHSLLTMPRFNCENPCHGVRRAVGGILREHARDERRGFGVARPIRHFSRTLQRGA